MKKRITTETRLAIVEAYGKRKKAAIKKKEQSFMPQHGLKAMEEGREFSKPLRSLAPRLKAIITIAKRMSANNIPFGETDKQGHFQFLSYRTKNNIGFIYPGPYCLIGITGMTKENDLCVNSAEGLSKINHARYPHLWTPEVKCRMKKFITGYNKFEKDFYKYVDSLKTRTA